MAPVGRRPSSCWSVAVLLAVGFQLGAAAGTGMSANPIRRVVTMLQEMQEKIEEEGKKEEDLFERFMCYCRHGTGDLEESIKKAEASIPQLESSIEEAGAGGAQLQGDIKKAKADRDDAKNTLDEGIAMREKEKGAFEKDSSELKANIEALKKAIAALEKGMAGGFLQTSTADRLRRIAESADLSSSDRDMLTSFLAVGSDSADAESYAPQSGEITGMLKQILDDMMDQLKSLEEEEAKAVKDFEEMSDAKKNEIAALTKAIEDKTGRMGKLGVQLVELKENLEDTEASLEEDKSFLKGLKRDCGNKEEEWKLRQKTRAEELLAISETIKILNDDDSLDLFKKTLPSPSLLQVAVSSKDMQASALKHLRGQKDYRLKLVAMALSGKKVSFAKVLKMIDDMIGVLAKEQKDDDTKKKVCEKEIDETEDEHKSLMVKISDLSKSIDSLKDQVDTLVQEIKALEASIKELDKQVADATEQRKAEHKQYTEDLAANNAALELLGMAKNRLNKFYNPKLHKKAPSAEEAGLLEEEQVVNAFGGEQEATSFVQVSAQARSGDTTKDAPDEPPETWEKGYKKKGEESSGVVQMIDLLRQDLQKDISEMETEEKNAQAEYEETLAAAAKKRALDVKSLSNKEAARADTEEELLATKKERKTTKKEALAVAETLHDLHQDCDWLLQNYAVRAEARQGEVESLQSAKAVLSGADFSFVQVEARKRRFLRHMPISPTLDA